MAPAWTCPACSTYHPATGWDDPPNECRVCEDWPKCEECDDPVDPDDIEDDRCEVCREDVEVPCLICETLFDAPYDADAPYICETCAPGDALDFAAVVAVIERLREERGALRMEIHGLETAAEHAFAVIRDTTPSGDASQRAIVEVLAHRAETAEAERDRLRRQLQTAEAASAEALACLASSRLIADAARHERDRLRRMLDDLQSVASDPRTATAAPDETTQTMRAAPAQEE